MTLLEQNNPLMHKEVSIKLSAGRTRSQVVAVALERQGVDNMILLYDPTTKVLLLNYYVWNRRLIGLYISYLCLVAISY